MPNIDTEELTTEEATEAIARRLSEEKMGTDAMWELFLTEAYKEYYKL